MTLCHASCRILAMVVGLVLLNGCASMVGDGHDPEGEAAAEAAFRANRFANAAAHYEDLLLAAPRHDAETGARLASRLADVHYEWALADALAADQERNPAGYAEAIARCRLAGELDPARDRKFSAAAAKFTRQMNTLAYEQAVAIAKIDPDGTQRRREIAILMGQANALRTAERLEAARDKYRAVLALDPYNREAIFRLQRLANESSRIARLRRRTDDAERLAEAEWRYVQPIPAQTNGAAAAPPTTAPTPPTMEQRLDGIVYRHVDFRETPLAEIVARLAAGSQVPEAPGGVRFRFDGLDPAAPQWPTATFTASDISLRHILDAILPPLGLAYACDQDAVVIRPAAP